MTRIEDHREYLWNLNPVAPKDDAQDLSGAAIDDEWAADLSGASDAAASGADIELHSGHAAVRRKHTLGRTQSNAELQIAAPSREDTRGRALKPTLTDEIALDQAALDRQQMEASRQRLEAAAQLQAQEAHASQQREVNEERRLVQDQAGQANARRSPTQRAQRTAKPATARPQYMDDEETAPEDAPVHQALRRASGDRR